MKKILSLLLLSIFTLLSFSSQAQTKEDLIDCLEMVFELDEIQPAFQHEGSFGNTLYIYRPANRSINQRAKDNAQLLYELTDDDFRYAPNPVKFITDGEARDLNIDPSQLVNLSFGATPTRINVRLISTLKENRETMQGVFSFLKEGNTWNISSQEVMSTRR